MCAEKSQRAKRSQLTPARVFGQRLRELREQRRWNQGDLAARTDIHRTAVNKVERGSRSDVSISQLFSIALALDTSPINLLTPSDPDTKIELPGGRVVSGADFRAWVRGAPLPGGDVFAAFFDLPVDEQRDVVANLPREGRRRIEWAALGPERQEAHITEMLERLERTRKEKDG
jgi:transcriptional regulator with XRE-family HTH domain